MMARKGSAKWPQLRTINPALPPIDDAPIGYMKRTRDYYAAIGYTTPYRWAHYTSAPFQPLNKPLNQSRVAIITTAAPFDATKGDQGPARNTMAEPSSIRSMTATLRGSTTCGSRTSPMTAPTPRRPTAAPGSRWRSSKHLAAAGTIGEVAPRFLGAPTNRSHRVTIETDAPEIL